MAFIDDTCYDAALQEIKTNVTDLFICKTAEPTDWTSANANKLGTKNAPTLGAIGNGASGRKFTVSAITTGGSVTVTDTAGWWALVDIAGTKLWAAGPLSATQAVTSGNTFTLSAFDVNFTDATDV